MTAKKRPRGRPRGSGKDDTPYLAQIADQLVHDPSLKPTTAMKRLIANQTGLDATDETLIRRWQVKWKLHAHALMIAGRERARPRAPAEYPSLSAIADTLNGPAMTGAANTLASPSMRASFERKAAWVQTLKQLESAPWVRAINDFENSPTAKLLREVADAWPLTKLTEIENSPAMREMTQAVESAKASSRQFDHAVRLFASFKM